jgi:hypothetical protein
MEWPFVFQAQSGEVKAIAQGGGAAGGSCRGCREGVVPFSQDPLAAQLMNVRAFKGVSRGGSPSSRESPVHEPQGAENVGWAVPEIQEGLLTTTSVIPQSRATGVGRCNWGGEGR